MPSGNASHKGSSVKPNTNTDNSLDQAADLATNPDELLLEGPDAIRAEEAPKNEAATQRQNNQK